MTQIDKAAAIGGGVIGAGWIARMLLNGMDVSVYDPHPDAERTVREVLANADRAYGRMTLAPLAAPGKLTFAVSIEEAVKGAGIVQESVPERENLKCGALAEIDAHAPEDAIIGSSTSGLLPSRLQRDLCYPGRFMVTHPFNPVYLLPLVEIVGGEQTDPVAIKRAKDHYGAIGMKPLVVRREIDAFIADRLLEAVWREGLWLIHDDVATTEEIDDAIRYGFGLRWAQMGLFETYRIAGGEAGMKHFISQFGPALKWPWTKLMDVPELTDELIERIAGQSDAQSGIYDVRELERIRDDNLVAILQALKNNHWGAGQTLKEYEDRLYARSHRDARSAKVDAGQPLCLHRTRVREDWVDYNGHLTESRYAQVFCDGTDAFLQYIGMDGDYLAGGHSVYTVETHIRFLREAGPGDPLEVKTQLLGYDEKRLRIFHELYGVPEGALLATAEHMLLHVDTRQSRACPMGGILTNKLDALWAGQRDLPAPDCAGRAIREVTPPHHAKRPVSTLGAGNEPGLAG